jgi:hypothetical protein
VNGRRSGAGKTTIGNKLGSISYRGMIRTDDQLMKHIPRTMACSFSSSQRQ